MRALAAYASLCMHMAWQWQKILRDGARRCLWEMSDNSKVQSRQPGVYGWYSSDRLAGLQAAPNWLEILSRGK